ncbi:Ku protein [Lacipirellula sp.]|uniref:non-homologous end joining protein Ku n=1 Tax=Lacipirellula sp. TaxID=2691419 RepID=UPI003D0DBC0B
MPRPVWKGHISFGLVNVPVVLYATERRAEQGFKLIDSRNAARVRYERVNEETGEEVPWDQIVKGFEFEEGQYVLLSKEELENASAEMTKAIEIEQFVDREEIGIRYFDRPYLIAPTGKSEKGYVLLREAISGAEKAGLARVVIRARQYLAALVVEGDALILELLRYADELQAIDDFELPGSDLREYKVTKKEIELASKLIEGMSGEWDPAQFKDEYRNAIDKMIQKKIKSGQTEAITDIDADEPKSAPASVNFMEMLKKSVAGATKKGSPKPRTSRRTAPRKRVAKKKQAG